MIASVDDWGTVWVGYTATGRRISALMGSERLDSLAFSPDGKCLHGHDWFSEIFMTWDVATGNVKRCLVLQNSAVAFSPDGKYVAIGRRGGTMSVRDLTTWAEVRRFGTHGKATAPLAFSPDGKRLASSGRKRTIQVWDVATGRLEGRFPDLRVPDGLIVENLEHQVAFSPDGKTIAVAEMLTTLSVWDIATGRRVRRFHHLPSEDGFTFAPDGRALVSGGPYFRFWDVARGHEIGRFPRLGEIVSLAFRADGKAIATASGEELQLWEVSTARELRRMNGPLQSIRSVAFAPDGKVLASSGIGGSLQLWDAATGRELRRVPALHGWVAQVAFSPDGKSFAAGDERGAHLWETATGREIPRFSRLPSGPIDLLCFGPGGTTIALYGQDVIRLWGLEADRQIKGRSFPSIWTMAVSPGGSTLAAGGDSGVLTLWNLKDGGTTKIALKQISEDDPASICAVAFSPDGKTLASAGGDNRVTLRDPLTGKERARLEGHEGAVTSLAFAPDGKTIASGSADGTVLVWDLENVGKR
jgi:WD40 repeat protein